MLMQMTWDDCAATAICHTMRINVENGDERALDPISLHMVHGLQKLSKHVRNLGNKRGNLFAYCDQILHHLLSNLQTKPKPSRLTRVTRATYLGS